MRTVPATPPEPLLWTEGTEIMNEVQMHPDDYVLWLKGMFDTLGDRMPTREEWNRLREQNVMQVGDVVMRRVEEREIAHREKMRRAKEAEEVEAKMKAYQHMQDMYAQKAQDPNAKTIVSYQPGMVLMVDDSYTNISPQLAARAMSAVNLPASAKKR